MQVTSVSMLSSWKQFLHSFHPAALFMCVSAVVPGSSCSVQSLRTSLQDYFEKGEYIIREGEEGNTFFIISKGEVRYWFTQHGLFKSTYMYKNNFDILDKQHRRSSQTKMLFLCSWPVLLQLPMNHVTFDHLPPLVWQMRQHKHTLFDIVCSHLLPTNVGTLKERMKCICENICNIFLHIWTFQWCFDL